MENVNPKDQLLDEGLRGYPDAKRAIQAFENLIGEVAKEVMGRHIEKLRLVTGNQDLNTQALPISGAIFPNPHKSGVVGINLVAPDTWGIYIGVKWAQSRTLETEKPQAFVSVTCTAGYKRENLFRVLNSSDECKGVGLDKPDGWPPEVHLSNPLTEEVTFDSLQESIEKVLSCFIKIMSNAGNLQAVFLGQTSSATEAAKNSKR